MVVIVMLRPSIHHTDKTSRSNRAFVEILKKFHGQFIHQARRPVRLVDGQIAVLIGHPSCPKIKQKIKMLFIYFG